MTSQGLLVTRMVTNNILLPTPMPKHATPLTATQIKNAKAAEKPQTLFDGIETGLHVLIQPNGSKTFRLKVQIQGKDRRLTLGAFPDLSLSDARQKAAELKKQIRQGIDPTAEIVINTFESVSGKFIDWKSSVMGRMGTTVRKYRECLDNDLLPLLGNKDITVIHTVDIVPILETINKRSNSLAIKAQELVGMIIKYAIQRGLRPPYTHLDLTGIIQRNKAKSKKISDDIPATAVSISKLELFRSRSP